MMKQPVLFIGHGDPMNALRDNAFTRSLKKIGENFKECKENEKPKAILIISAHWLTKGTFISTKSDLIYDFYGFPNELYEVKYPVKPSPMYKEVSKLLNIKAEARGLDHGAWTILKHLFPKADIPVMQLSIDFGKPLEYHFDLAKKLASLRDKGVVIIGSGNVVHNLERYFTKDMQPYLWAIEFDEWVKGRIEKRELHDLIDYDHSQAATLSVPTTDHYIPLLYTVALWDDKEDITFTYEEVTSSMSMRCLKIG